MKVNKSKYIIDKKNEGLRLDKAITKLNMDISRVAAQRLLEAGKIYVNRKSVKAFI